MFFVVVVAALVGVVAVRRVRDPDALMHVCTALHVGNDLCTLYSFLLCRVDADVFFALLCHSCLGPCAHTHS